jgi:hypothetical protein
MKRSFADRLLGQFNRFTGNPFRVAQRFKNCTPEPSDPLPFFHLLSTRIVLEPVMIDDATLSTSRREYRRSGEFHLPIAVKRWLEKPCRADHKATNPCDGPDGAAST